MTELTAKLTRIASRAVRKAQAENRKNERICHQWQTRVADAGWILHG